MVSVLRQAAEQVGRKRGAAARLTRILAELFRNTGLPLRCFFRNTKACRTRMSYYEKARATGTGQDPVVSFRLGVGFKEAIDRWRSTESDKPSRSDAIRRLIGTGLQVAAIIR
jgi:hypothetical protein